MSIVLSVDDDYDDDDYGDDDGDMMMMMMMIVSLADIRLQLFQPPKVD